MARSSFKDSVHRWSTTCLECRQPCEVEEAVQLGLGHVMHRECYEFWVENEDLCSRIGIMKRLAMPIVYLLPGERGLMREQIAERRHETLYGSKETQLDASPARSDLAS